MRALKSILRWFLALQAVILILTPIAGVIGSIKNHALTHSFGAPHHHASGIVSYGIMLVFVALGAVFAMAWWTTRKPSSTLNLWALGASLLYLVEGIGCFLVLRHFGQHSGSMLDIAAIGVAGLFVFSRRETMPATAAPRRAPVAGDRTNPLTRHAVTALSTVAQIAALILWSRWAYSHDFLRARGLTWIVLVTLASVFSTIIHECGHAVMAWCFEMGLLSFKAGPFQWIKREGKWKFKFYPTGILTPGGAVGAVPTTLDPPRWEELLVIAAGPVANLIFGLPAIWAVLHDTWGSYEHTWEFIAFTGSFCLIAAVLNLFPFMSEEGAYSDGARILQIVTHSPLDDYHRAMASIAATTLTARRYRDLDIAQIERAAILFPNDFRGLHLLLCASHYYEDCGRFPEASASLAAAESIYNNNSIDLPGPLHTIFVIGHAYLNHDAAAARLWWDRMESKKSERSNVDFWLAKAALLWIEGNLHDAEDAWQEANLEAQSLPQFGAYDFDRYRCALLREAFDKPADTPAAELPATPAIVSAPAPSLPPLAESIPERVSSLLPAVAPAPAPAIPTVLAPRASVFNIPMPVSPAVVSPVAEVAIPTPITSAPAIADPVAPVATAAVPTPPAPARPLAAAPASQPADAVIPEDEVAAALARLMPAPRLVDTNEADTAPRSTPVAFRIPDSAATATAPPVLAVEPVVPAPPPPFRAPDPPAPLPPARLAEPAPTVDLPEFRLPEPPTPPAERPHSGALAAFFHSAPRPQEPPQPFAELALDTRTDTAVGLLEPPTPLPEFHLPEPPATPAPHQAFDPLAFFRTPPRPQEAPPAFAELALDTQTDTAVGLLEPPTPLPEFHLPEPTATPAPHQAFDPLAFFRTPPRPQEPIPAFPEPALAAEPDAADAAHVESPAPLVAAPAAAPAFAALVEPPTQPAPVVIAAVAAAPAPIPVPMPPPTPAPGAVLSSELAEPVPVVVTRGAAGSYTRIPAASSESAKSTAVPNRPPRVDPMDLIRSEMIEILRNPSA